MEAILNLNFFFLFLIYTVGTFVGVLITRMYLTATIFPISKAIASSLGVTILYLGAEQLAPINFQPYGDFIACMIIGLFAENIMGSLLSPKGQLMSIRIIKKMSYNWMKKHGVLSEEEIKALQMIGKEKEGAIDEGTTGKEDSSKTNSLGEKNRNKGDERKEVERKDPFRSEF